MSTLDENVLDTRQEQYLDWLCTAPAEREPASKRLYAEQHHIAITTLRRWEKKEHFRKEWTRRVDEVVGSPERTQKLLDNLFDKAMRGDTNAAKLYLQTTGKLAPAQVTVNTEKRAAELSDAELDQLIGSMAAREQEKRLRVVG
jgi:hypothetical protein